MFDPCACVTCPERRSSSSLSLLCLLLFLFHLQLWALLVVVHHLSTRCARQHLLCLSLRGSCYSAASTQGSAFTVEKSREPGKDGKGKGNSDFEIFVKNLPFEMDEKTLRTDFLECGEIDRMHMPVVADTQKTMGFAWVTFKNAEGLKKALEFNDEEYGGRRLFIEKSGQHRAGDDKGKGQVQRKEIGACCDGDG